MSLRTLKTEWGTNITDKPLQEYPRPQFVRKSYFNLNGYWDYAITKTDVIPKQFDGKILVPFSPESILSGVNRQLKPNEYLYYRTVFTLPKGFVRDIVLLNFGAVDQVCDVFVNGVHMCCHDGGYNAFSVDVTAALKAEDNELIVRVRDFTDTTYRTCGKQSSRRGGMWYTPQSGIWQTVWMESVPAQYLSAIRITPDFDKAQVTVEADYNFDDPITVKILDGDVEIAQNDGKGRVTIAFPDGKFIPWTPENPYLYNLKIIARRDWVESYFGMRKFSCEKVGDYHRLMLNNKPYFHNGLLDQGYFSDGLYTAPSDEAMIFDISTAKKLGFNMLRKHIKVEPLRWYYHCDRLGMLVWQDMPSGGTRQHKMTTLYLPHAFNVRKIKDNNYRRNSRATEQSRNTYIEEYCEMINQLYNCVSIAMWVPFNEGWGQFDAKQIAALTKDLDGTRTVDHASGWHDQGGGDIKSMHIYFKKVKMPKDRKRAVCLTEFGGYSFKVDKHSANLDKIYGYTNYTTLKALNNAIKELYERDVIANLSKGLCATVYTQLTDVEDEVNGLLTYDRKGLKVDVNMIKTVNSKLNLNELAQLVEKSAKNEDKQ